MSLRSILVANRGEIAVRIVRAARALGLRTVQAHSRADADMLAVRLADAAVEIGPSQAAKSYLNVEAILDAARASGVDAVHPGYGFLSENADFAERVEAAGLVFVGPTAETIRRMGDKAAARETAARAGVPVVPGSDGVLDDPQRGVALARNIGFPIMVKAAAGGGGRGIRVAQDEDALAQLLPQAAAEARAAFGNGGLYLERFIGRARHIEVQILGDGQDAIHLGERDCSLQRRRQKVWEEAPAAAVPQAVREALCDAAIRLARSCRYRGAGTVEFLYDDETRAFFFIEMNTRIQVEHPVTEMITGIDLVGEQIRIAGGEPLRYAQSDIATRGHAIEVRINAEDAARNFAPSPGRVGALTVPGGFGVRFDTYLHPGCQIPPFYDSLLGKLVVWGEDRADALRRLGVALAELRIEGIATTTSLHATLARAPEVADNAVHTRWLEQWLDAERLGAAGPDSPGPTRTGLGGDAAAHDAVA